MFNIDSNLDTSGIESTTITGCIFTIFFKSAAEAEKFATKYSLNSGLDKNEMTIDILLPAPANQENLKECLARFEEEDFSQKQQFLDHYKIFTTTNSIEYIIHLITDYIYFFDYKGMLAKKQLLENAMPVYMEIISQTATYNMDASSDFTVNDIALNNLQVAKAWLSSVRHIRSVLIPLQVALEDYQDESITKDDLIEELQGLLDMASQVPFPDFGRLIPSLHKELADNVLFVDEKLSDLYSTIANQLSILLETQDLQFQSSLIEKELDKTPFLETQDLQFQSSLEKKELDKTPRFKKALSRLNALKASDDIMELLDFSPHTLRTFTRCSPQMSEKKSSRNYEAVESENIKIKSDFQPQNGQSPYSVTPCRRGKTRVRSNEVEQSGSIKNSFASSPQRYPDESSPPRFRKKYGNQGEKKSNNSLPINRKLDFSPKAQKDVGDFSDPDPTNVESWSNFLLRVLASRELQVGAFILITAGAIGLTVGSLGISGVILGMAAGTAAGLAYAGGVTVGFGAC